MIAPSSRSGPENWEYGHRDLSCWPCDTLYPPKLALTLPKSCAWSVGTVRSWTEAMEFREHDGHPCFQLRSWRTSLWIYVPQRQGGLVIPRGTGPFYIAFHGSQVYSGCVLFHVHTGSLKIICVYCILLLGKVMVYIMAVLTSGTCSIACTRVSY
jgi:hypothetical protein